MLLRFWHLGLNRLYSRQCINLLATDDRILKIAYEHNMSRVIMNGPACFVRANVSHFNNRNVNISQFENVDGYELVNCFPTCKHGEVDVRDDFMDTKEETLQTYSESFKVTSL